MNLKNVKLAIFGLGYSIHTDAISEKSIPQAQAIQQEINAEVFA